MAKSERVVRRVGGGVGFSDSVWNPLRNGSIRRSNHTTKRGKEKLSYCQTAKLRRLLPLPLPRPFPCLPRILGLGAVRRSRGRSRRSQDDAAIAWGITARDLYGIPKKYGRNVSAIFIGHFKKASKMFLLMLLLAPGNTEYKELRQKHTVNKFRIQLVSYKWN